MTKIPPPSEALADAVGTAESGVALQSCPQMRRGTGFLHPCALPAMSGAVRGVRQLPSATGGSQVGA